MRLFKFISCSIYRAHYWLQKKENKETTKGAPQCGTPLFKICLLKLLSSDNASHLTNLV